MINKRFKTLQEACDFLLDEKNKAYVFGQLVQTIKLAHANDEDQRVFAQFDIDEGEYEYIDYTVHSEDWLDSLESALKYFEGAEDYLRCAEIQSIINEIQK